MLSVVSIVVVHQSPQSQISTLSVIYENNWRFYGKVENKPGYELFKHFMPQSINMYKIHAKGIK